MSQAKFKKLMTHKFTITKRKRNFSGDFEVEETFENVPGFAQYGKSTVAGFNGEDVIAIAIIFLQDDAPIDSEHPHWVIDQTAPYMRHHMGIVAIDPIDDPRTGKTHHYECAVEHLRSMRR